MNKILIVLFSFLSLTSFAQVGVIDSIQIDTLKVFAPKINAIYERENTQEAVWDNGIPILPEDGGVMELIYQLNEEGVRDVNKLSNEQVRIYRELGVEFYNRGMYQEADFYLSKIKNYTEKKHIRLKEIFQDSPYVNEERIKKDIEKEYQAKLDALLNDKESTLSEDDKKNAEQDAAFIKDFPQSFDKLTKEDLENLSKKIQSQISKLEKEKQTLIDNHGSQELIDLKDQSIKNLEKEKDIVNLSIDKDELKGEVLGLEYDKTVLKRFLWGALIGIIIAILAIVALLQRKTIRVQDGEIEKQLNDINKKNVYLEYAARIIRHDMHSGINTYMPRGLSSLQKRIQPEIVEELKIGPSLKMIKEGLAHTQKVYKNVYEFTNLVKVKADFKKTKINLKDSLENYLLNTSYHSQVEIQDLGEIDANEQLLCSAIDNLIRNGLKYNHSNDKKVKIYRITDTIIVEDNGVGLPTDKFNELIKKGIDTESETGLGLSITKAIVEEHGFSLTCETFDGGTKIKIRA